MANKDLEDYINTFAKGDIIYAQDVAQKFHLQTRSAYEELEKFVDTGTLTSILELECPHCNRLLGIWYDSFFEIPNTMICPQCNTLIRHLYEEAVVVYKKVAD